MKRFNFECCWEGRFKLGVLKLLNIWRSFLMKRYQSNGCLFFSLFIGSRSETYRDVKRVNSAITEKIAPNWRTVWRNLTTRQILIKPRHFLITCCDRFSDHYQLTGCYLGMNHNLGKCFTELQHGGVFWSHTVIFFLTNTSWQDVIWA